MKKSLLLSLFILIALSANIFAQHTNKLVYKAKGPIAFLYELKAILEEEDGKLLLKMMPEGSHVDANSQTIDIAINDEIIYVNGKKVKTTEDFKKEYDAIKIGDKYELGVARNDKTLNTVLKKREDEKKDDN